MKNQWIKQLLYGVLFIFLLASCNLGSKGAPLDVDPTAEQIAIDAAVASTLAALPTEISEPVEVLTPVMTEAPEITNTPVITSTPLPTEAPTEIVEPTVEPTITATPLQRARWLENRVLNSSTFTLTQWCAEIMFLPGTTSPPASRSTSTTQVTRIMWMDMRR